MNERTTLEIIAPTVEEALAQGLAQLGLTADAVSVEVIDTGSKGFLGLGGRQVRVRLTVNPPAGEPVRKTEPAPAREPRPAPVKKTESKPAPVPAKKAEPKPAPAPVKKVEPQPAPAPAESGHRDQLIEMTESIITRLIHLLGLKAQVSAHLNDDDREDRRSILVDVRGDDLSALIGRHAETLNAFQHIASLMVGKESKQWVQLTVDVEGYRLRREKQLQQLAKRMADQVAKTGRKSTLEPMPSSERRLIHIALREHPSVTTESTGEDPYRKVVILPKE